MSSSRTTPAPFRRRQEFERQEHVTVYSAGGLGGLAIFALVCAAWLGRAYIGFSIARQDVDRYVDEHARGWGDLFPAKATRPAELKAPDRPRSFFLAATVLLAADAVVLGVAAWL
ncbi:hypothetical protein [Alloactinosynnema sp. L-07]|uniref:hypothetical protein n=1 Tax=Alloactinosynnema sp. L-07 TaxID=1653480 RepID=UPI00065EFF28|nr:hypothetical protein [Alloactinosynnema sp. L-07]CRK60142.1 hypothetical protein [Alloactinosynnema sp. L-07]